MNNPHSLHGKKALVTGGKRRIGRGIALSLAEAGCDVGINDIVSDADADETMKLIRERSCEAEFFQADISNSVEVEAMFTDFHKRFGRIDILVNNPYGGTGQPFLDISEENWDANIDIGLKGFFLCSQQAARAMVEQGDGGSIVSTSSVHGARAWKGDTAYGTAKAGILRMTESNLEFAAMPSYPVIWTQPTRLAHLPRNMAVSKRGRVCLFLCFGAELQRTSAGRLPFFARRQRPALRECRLRLMAVSLRQDRVQAKGSYHYSILL